jgi:hypothetical protein
MAVRLGGVDLQLLHRMLYVMSGAFGVLRRRNAHVRVAKSALTISGTPSDRDCSRVRGVQHARRAANLLLRSAAESFAARACPPLLAILATSASDKRLPSLCRLDCPALMRCC